MPGTHSIQEVVHSLEQGKLAKFITICLSIVALLGATLMMLFVNFKGLSTAEGMEQAVIAREIARGNGFTTKSIRPAAIWQINNHTGEFPAGRLPETYHAPANPFLNSLTLSLFKGLWAKAPERKGEFVFAQDRVIAATSILCFFGAVFVSFFTIKRLFDTKIAILACAMVLVCDLLWEYSLSGLPQMLMLLLLAATIHMIVIAIQSQEQGRRIDIPLALGGLFLGLLFLTHHGMALVFVGAMVFCSLHFRPKGLAALWMAGFFLICAVPWLVRTFTISGNPAGLALYALVDGIGGSEGARMRSLSALSLEGFNLVSFQSRIRGGLTSQLGGVIGLLGMGIAAPVFFLSLLHPFKRPETSLARWFILCIWLGASLASATLGRASGAVHSHQFQMLFIPIMSAYGLAFLLVLWNRIGLPSNILRVGFIALIFLISAVSFIFSVIPSRQAKVHWPPYLPTFIGAIGGQSGFMKSDELVSSDIPWAVAWYADRDCLWLPKTMKDFYEINDFLRVGRPVRGLLLTPASSNETFVDKLVRGEYSDWLPLLTRSGIPPNFPLTAALPIPIVDRRFPDMLFLADYARWDPEASEKYLQEQEEKEKSKEEPSKEPPKPNEPGRQDPEQ